MKVALITGASGGIGKATCKKFIDNGYFTIGFYNKSKSIIDDFCADLKAAGLGDYFFPVKVDLSSSEGIKNAFDIVEKNFKHIDVLVNNAGVELFKLITETTENEWDTVMNVNLKSVYLLTNLVLKNMLSLRLGKIVNVSSVWGNVGASCEVAYSASKSAIIGYTKALAKEVAPSNINVNCVCPGVIDTKMNARLTDTELDEVKSEIPKGRLGRAEEVADLIWYLCSDSADYITGQIVTIDGGYTV
ncbi:MAG: SDR family oxidoreductase [Clostridiales bacterium]|nr:SDR family oxidoreductase [Clostridiales bacterium]